MSIGERILQLRKRSGLSQEELAEKLNVSRQAVSKWEANQCMPDTEKVILLSDIFEVSTDYILKGKETGLTENKRKQLNINPVFLSCISLALCILSLFTAHAVYMSQFERFSVLAGMSVFLCGVLLFIFTYLHSDKSSEQFRKANRLFLLSFVWIAALIVFVPLCIFTVTFLGSFASFNLPNWFNMVIVPLIFIILYFAVCIASDIILSKRN